MSYGAERYGESREIGFGETLLEFRTLFERNTPFLLGVMGGIAAFYSLWDMTVGPTSQLFINLAITIFGQYFVIERLLADRLPDGRGSRRFRSIFGSGVLSGLGIVFGFLFLIFPGIFLLARWSIASPAVIEEDVGSVRALGLSWERTAASSLPLFFVYLLASGIYLVGLIVIVGLAEAAGQANSWPETIGTNLAVGVLTVFGWALSTAIYRCLTPRDTGIQDVFS